MLAPNMGGNEDFMPRFALDCKELLIFRAWAASGWVRIMFYFSLITVFILCVLGLIIVGYDDDAAYIFFAVFAILLFCVGSILYHRIFFEIIMGCLQIPRLIIAVEKLETAMRNNMEIRSSLGVKVTEDGTSQI